jgi:hypothetical protein
LHRCMAEICNEVLTIDFLGSASVDFGIGPLETLAWQAATSFCFAKELLK